MQELKKSTMQEEQKTPKVKKPKPELREVFEQKMEKHGKDFEKKEKVRRRTEAKEESKGASSGSNIDDEYHHDVGKSHVPLPDEEEGQEFGPPIFQRIFRAVNEGQPRKKRSMHPSAKAMQDSKDPKVIKKLKKMSEKPKLETEDPVRFTFMSYSLLSDAMMADSAGHLSKDDPCRDARYRRRRVLAEIEASNCDIVCLQEVTNYKEPQNFFIKKL